MTASNLTFVGLSPLIAASTSALADGVQNPCPQCCGPHAHCDELREPSDRRGSSASLAVKCVRNVGRAASLGEAAACP